MKQYFTENHKLHFFNYLIAPVFFKMPSTAASCVDMFGVLQRSQFVHEEKNIFQSAKLFLRLYSSEQGG